MELKWPYPSLPCGEKDFLGITTRKKINPIKKITQNQEQDS